MLGQLHHQSSTDLSLNQQCHSTEVQPVRYTIPTHSSYKMNYINSRCQQPPSPPSSLVYLY